MMYINIKYIHITQSYSKTRKKMCVKTTLSVNLTDTVGKGLKQSVLKPASPGITLILVQISKYWSKSR